MKISILTPDLSHNCLGRAYLLAKILQRHYEIEIVGPMFGGSIWEPLAKLGDMEYKFIKLEGRFKPYWQLKELFKIISGNVIYASKPLFFSFGIGLLEKLHSRRPLILDIDDWQMGFMKETCLILSFTHYLKFLASSALQLYNMGSYWNNLISEKLARFADAVTVSNNFLKEKFGGTVIWHGRDTRAFNPEKFDKKSIREQYGIDGSKKILMFFGSLRPYKGIEDLIEAVSLLKDPDIILFLVGVEGDNYSQNLIRFANDKLNQRFKAFGLQPFEKIPEFLAMSDVVVIPQRRNFATIGQVPAKVFDAMAMAKPIIATNVSDLPEILDECGWIIEPENPQQLVETIQYVFDNPDAAAEKGQNAREKCKARYSWDVLEEILVGIFAKYR
jgi:glycosyltransferase involved in cell wall biosynthesis